MNNLKVVFLSDWIVNPYKELLSKHLALQGVIVNEHLWSTFFLFKVLQNGRFDILHLHTLHPFLLGKNKLTKTLKLLFFASQIILLKLLGTKTIWTVHEWSDKLYGGTNSLSIPMTAIAVRLFAAIIVHCPSTQAELTQLLNLQPERVYVIPHGNYINYYQNQITSTEARAKLSLSSDSLAFILFGNVYRYKGVIEAIEAFQLFDCQNATLIVAGQIKESGLETEINTAIDNNPNIVLIPKRIDDNEVQIYLNAADCILLPYTVFTTSGVAILGMSFGKACIAPQIGFFQDVIDEQGGFLYELPHQQGLASAMERALTNQKQLQTMGTYNLTRMKQWNWDYVVELTLAAYLGNRR